MVDRRDFDQRDTKRTINHPLLTSLATLTAFHILTLWGIVHYGQLHTSLTQAEPVAQRIPGATALAERQITPPPNELIVGPVGQVRFRGELTDLYFITAPSTRRGMN